MAGWSELPQELLFLIVRFLVAYTDQVRFACVCTSWRSVLPTISCKGVQPWLWLPSNSTNKKHEKYYTLHGRTFHYLEVPADQFLGQKFRGSSHGLLVSIEDSPRITLINPITKVQISLPPRYKFPDVRKYSAKKIGTEYALEQYDPLPPTFPRVYLTRASLVHERFLDKVVLSSTPTTSNIKGNLKVAAIYGTRSHLAYCKLGDKKWTSISKRGGYFDAIFYEDKLYALTRRHELEVYELSAGYPKKIDATEPLGKSSFRSYLVNTSIGLLQVHRFYRSKRLMDYNNSYQTSKFNLYKYESGCRSWSQVDNIGGNVLFVGLNTSISIPTDDLPPGGFYKGNCIYFTDDNLEEHTANVTGGQDIGFYDLDSKLTKHWLCEMDDGDKSWKCLWPTPIWYMYNPKDFI